ncbi:MAG: hypothetical protein M3O28_08985 [Actinomycetota bacterium]|nr:hypothetical protein [Actinomycetota bacterium]
MSRERAQARARREEHAAKLRAQSAAERTREAAERARRERRALRWRYLRLWHHGPGFRRHKEIWASLATVALVVVVATYVITGSVGAIVLVLLVLVITGPVFVKLSSERK